MRACPRACCARVFMYAYLFVYLCVFHCIMPIWCFSVCEHRLEQTGLPNVCLGPLHSKSGSRRQPGWKLQCRLLHGHTHDWISVVGRGLRHGADCLQSKNLKQAGPFVYVHFRTDETLYMFFCTRVCLHDLFYLFEEPQ